jgi:hypothetical protein
VLDELRKLNEDKKHKSTLIGGFVFTEKSFKESLKNDIILVIILCLKNYLKI